MADEQEPASGELSQDDIDALFDANADVGDDDAMGAMGAAGATGATSGATITVAP